jgi:signal transduction histidine kinase
MKVKRSYPPRNIPTSGKQHAAVSRCYERQKPDTGDSDKGIPETPISAVNKAIDPETATFMEHARFLETAWEQLGEGLIVCDAHGKIILANSAARKLAQTDPRGMPLAVASMIWGKILDLDGREVAQNEWPCIKALRGEAMTQKQWHLVPAQGGPYDVLVSAIPLSAGDTKPAGAMITITDITPHQQRERTWREEAVRHERTRMANEIHDVLCQALTAIVLQLQTAEETLSEDHELCARHIRRACELAQQSLTEARRSMWSFRHESIQNTDPARTISRSAKQILDGTSIALDLSLQEQACELPPRVPFELLRICQEALTNVVKHSKASKVSVELLYRKRAVHLKVTDDGCGFARPSVSGVHQGFGLLSMRERIERLGGRIIVESQPGRGTRISATVPLLPALAARAAAV